MSEMLSGAEILCRALVDGGVEVIFGYPGGAIMPFYHALPDHPRLRHILVRHEQAGVVADAMAVAVEGRPGPVLIDVPKDVQNQKIEYGAPRARARGQSRPQTPGASPGLEDGVHKAARLIAGAERPLIMVGHGVILAQAYAEVRALAEKTGIPVITTLLGISAFPDGHPLHLGMPGMHGEVHVNRAIQHADVIIGIGLRFDDRVTGNTASFAPQARIVHIDLDRAEIGKNVPVTVGIVGDARDITRRLLAAVEPRRCERWLEHIRGFVRTRAESYRGGLSPEAILASIYEASHGDCTIVTDVGQHQMWVAKLYPYQHPNSHITSGGLGAMGFAVPAAMGVHLARPR